MTADTRSLQLSAAAVGLSALAFAFLLIPDRLAVSIAIGAVALGVILVLVRVALTPRGNAASAPVIVHIGTGAPFVLAFILFLGWGTRW